MPQLYELCQKSFNSWHNSLSYLQKLKAIQAIGLVRYDLPLICPCLVFVIPFCPSRGWKWFQGVFALPPSQGLRSAWLTCSSVDPLLALFGDGCDVSFFQAWGASPSWPFKVSSLAVASTSIFSTLGCTLLGPMDFSMSSWFKCPLCCVFLGNAVFPEALPLGSSRPSHSGEDVKYFIFLYTSAPLTAWAALDMFKASLGCGVVGCVVGQQQVIARGSRGALAVCLQLPKSQPPASNKPLEFGS